MHGRVLIVAGSDSGGGAGIQADIKTVTALAGYAMTAITALTAQNTEGVFAIHEVPADFVAAQMRLVLADLGADCVKIGMLHQPPVIDTVADVLAEMAGTLPVVVDPVMVAKGGHRLLVAEAVDTLRRRLVPMATVLTPNLPEAAALAGCDPESANDPWALADRLLDLGPQAVLVKGGHAGGTRIVDVLAGRDGGRESFVSERIETASTHGTGCTLASAVATGLAQGMPLREAVVRARAYVLEAMRTAPGYGRGHGPLNHAHTVRPFPG
jgi:hydroxymethylpyrimidine/phosphomethylpyrimidine kinase